MSGAEGEADEIVSRRAERLFDDLEEQHPRQVGAAVAATASHTWIKLAVVVVALLIGLATKQLGPERRVNVLAFPLFGVLAWNLLVYLWAIFGGFFGKKAGPGVALLGNLVGACH